MYNPVITTGGRAWRYGCSQRYMFRRGKFLDEKGFINVNSDMSTKTKGLYAVGDCTNKVVKQVQTACNDGAIAAFHILKYLN